MSGDGGTFFLPTTVLGGDAFIQLESEEFYSCGLTYSGIIKCCECLAFQLVFLCMQQAECLARTLPVPRRVPLQPMSRATGCSASVFSKPAHACGSTVSCICASTFG